MQDPTIDYSLLRLSKLIPKHAEDPDRLSKVKYMFFVILQSRGRTFLGLNRTLDTLKKAVTILSDPGPLGRL